MIQKIGIENYKSIDKLDFELGRFNVFIGENGCGKSNILEAIAFASSYQDLDDGKLSLMGVRVTEPVLFRNGFNHNNIIKDIHITVFPNQSDKIQFFLSNLNEPYSQWKGRFIMNDDQEFPQIVNKFLEREYTKVLFGEDLTHAKSIFNTLDKYIVKIVESNIIPYIIYAPENYFLRNYNIDSPYTQPLGTRGEGLLKLIKVIKKEKPEEYKEIVEQLHLIDWFSDIEITDDSLSGAEFKLNDKYLEDGIGGFDIKNANEGFFLLLFYITLFVSDYTPSFFAIDNIDTALNPKLCTKLIEVLTVLAKKHNKQALITTHNPSVLDGINLNDDSQRLFAVSRNKTGYTRVNRIEKKPPLEGEQSLKLSEQFLRGYIGGLPKNF